VSHSAACQPQTRTRAPRVGARVRFVTVLERKGFVAGSPPEVIGRIPPERERHPSGPRRPPLDPIARCSPDRSPRYLSATSSKSKAFLGSAGRILKTKGAFLGAPGSVWAVSGGTGSGGFRSDSLGFFSSLMPTKLPEAADDSRPPAGSAWEGGG